MSVEGLFGTVLSFQAKTEVLAFQGVWKNGPGGEKCKKLETPLADAGEGLRKCDKKPAKWSNGRAGDYNKMYEFPGRRMPPVRAYVCENAIKSPQKCADPARRIVIRVSEKWCIVVVL